MSKRKFKSYTLWRKWANTGWKPAITCLNLPWPAANPRMVLAEWMESRKSPHWKRGKTWMILPDDRRPK